MQDTRLTPAGAVMGLVGAVLLLVEGIRAVAMNDVLGTTSQLLMWIGLGVMAAGGVLLVLGVWQDVPDEPAGPAFGAPDTE